MKNKITLLAIMVMIITAFSGCYTISGLKSFAKCNFDFNSVSDVSICNINVAQKQGLKDFGLQDGLKIANAFATKQFPLSLNVNVDVKNPNTQTARLDGFDYILWIDNLKISEGSMNKQVSVAANQKVTMPIEFSVNLLDILTSEAKDKVVSFGCGLATNNADASRVKVSLKPYCTIGQSVMKFPTYITLGGDKIMPQN